MSDHAIAYRPRPDATPEGELGVLAAVYRFVLDCGEARRAEETRKAAGHSDREGRCHVKRANGPSGIANQGLMKERRNL
jgi:hypothetical protein